MVYFCTYGNMTCIYICMYMYVGMLCIGMNVSMHVYLLLYY